MPLLLNYEIFYMSKYITLCAAVVLFFLSANMHAHVRSNKEVLAVDSVLLKSDPPLLAAVPEIKTDAALNGYDNMFPKNVNEDKEPVKDLLLKGNSGESRLTTMNEPPYAPHTDKLESSEDVTAVYGLDVSHYQSSIDWNQISNYENHHISYVYIKATEGSSLNDPYYQRNVDEAHRMGIPMGSYHYFSNNVSGIVQFEHFKNTIERNKQDLLPVVDVEECRYPAPQLRANLQQFLDACESYLGVKPIIYTGVFFYNTYLSQQFKGYQFFIARYSKDEPTLNDAQNWDLWQFTDRGRVQGINGHVDVSRMNMGLGIDRIRFKTKRGGPIIKDKKPNSLPGMDLGETGTGRIGKF